MQQTSEHLNNERLINWFVDYCQRKCGQAETSQDRDFPLVRETAGYANRYGVATTFAVNAKSQCDK